MDGEDGAQTMAQTLLGRGVSVDFILDEGLAVVDSQIVPGMALPTAMWVQHPSDYTGVDGTKINGLEIFLNQS